MDRYRSLQLAALLLLVLGMVAQPARAGHSAGSNSSATPGPARHIQVNGYKFDPRVGTPDLPADLRYEGPRPAGPSYYIVQFLQPVNEPLKRSLRAEGAIPLRYIHEDALLVRADQDAIRNTRSLPSVRWVGLFHPAYKLSPRLAKSYDDVLNAARPSGKEGRGPLIDTSVRIPVQIQTMEPSELPGVASLVAALGATQIARFTTLGGLLRAEVPRSALVRLAREPGVRWIDRESPNYLLNDTARWVTQSGDLTTHSTPVHDHQILGTGQIVTIGDSGIDFAHSAFADPDPVTGLPIPPGPGHRKVTDYYVPEGAYGDAVDAGNNHGTHVAGSVAGDDGARHQYDVSGADQTLGPHDGQAVDATIQVQDFNRPLLDGTNPGGIYPPPDYHIMLDEASVRGSKLHTNSWGNHLNQYDVHAAEVDDYIFTDDEDLLALFAAGNDGPTGSSLTSNANCKNVVTVGASGNGANEDSLALGGSPPRYFSSRGPTSDQRRKPDVMAPGESLWSAAGCGGSDPGCPENNYKTLSGTSMATPTTAGAAALIRQYYMGGWYPRGDPLPDLGLTPSAALTKATLVNSATQMSGTDAFRHGLQYPNNDQGWGRILLDDALYFAGDSRRLVIDDNRYGLVGSGTTGVYGETATYTILVTAALPIEATLVWSDHAGDPAFPPYIVNNLDLVVTAPDGTVYRGNRFQWLTDHGESEPRPNGTEANTDEGDALNNVEGVLVKSNVQTGLWTIRVSAYKVPEGRLPGGRQPYALVVTGGIAGRNSILRLDRAAYAAGSSVRVTLVDPDLNLSPGSPDNATVQVSSGVESAPETLTLVETGPATGVFSGSIPLDATTPAIPNDQKLQVATSDQITAQYCDASDGLGGSSCIQARAGYDGAPPAISGLAVTNLGLTQATVTWSTDPKPADGVVWYGSTRPPGLRQSSTLRATSHQILLTGLAPGATYYYWVSSTDASGNQVVADNGGAYYQFTTQPVHPPAPISADWPADQNNPERRGESPSDLIPPLQPRWSTPPITGFFVAPSTPIVAAGTLFSTSSDGYIRARNSQTGTLTWGRQLGDGGYPNITPVVANGVVYTIHKSAAGALIYALDPATGATRQGWPVGPPPDFTLGTQATFIVADGMLFTIGSSPWTGGEVMAFDATGGSLVWSQPVAFAGLSDPTVGGGMVFGAIYGGGVLPSIVALDEFNGSPRWTSQPVDDFVETVLYADGAVYAVTSRGTVYALDASSGVERWHQALAIYNPTAMAYDGSTLYVGLGDSYIGLDPATGSMTRQAYAGATVYGSVVYADGSLVGTTGDGFLRVFSAFNGLLLDERNLGSGSIGGHAAVAGGWVWVIDGYGSVFAFQGLSPAALTITPMSQGHAMAPGSTFDYPIALRNLRGQADTLEVTPTPGYNYFDVALYKDDGVTPLPDTDGDGAPDTGSLAAGATANIIARVTASSFGYPAGQGTVEITTITGTAHTVPAQSRSAYLISTVPEPGVALGPNAYASISPGGTATAAMTIANQGAVADTIDVTASSQHGWTVRLFKADGVTPLADTDGDSIPDAGPVQALQSAGIVVKVDMPVGTPLDAADATRITATSSLDPSKSGSATVMIEYVGSASTGWPQFQHDRQRGGVATISLSPPLTRTWTVDTGSLPMRWSGPIIDSQTAYFTTPEGSLFAVDLSNGGLIGEWDLGDNGPFAGAPVSGNGSVYATFVTGGGSSLSLFAVDPATGSVRWRSDAPSGAYVSALATPVLAAGKVYWTDGPGRQLHANDASTGARLWSYPLSDDVAQGPAYWAGRLFVGDLAGNLLSLDAATHALLWSTRLAAPITTAPVIAGNVVYVGDASGSVRALDAVSGTPLWTASALGSRIDRCAPVVAGGLVFVGATGADASSGWMRALDATTGALRWSFQVTGGSVESPAAYAGGKVFFAARNGTLYALNAADGAPLQSLPLAPAGSTSSVAIAGGTLVVGDESGAVVAFAPDGDGDGDPDATDCAPLNPAIHHGATETCNGIDDNCEAGIDEGFPDGDADGQADCVDTCTDTDHDGFGNPFYPGNTCPTDNCPFTSNPTQADADADGLGDACDTCTDSDHDGYGNPGYPLNTCINDNCPAVYNPFQTDADADGVGDACDTCTDTDHDGFGNPGYAANTCATDNCATVSNPSQTDTDQDGYGDACDCSPTNPAINPGVTEGLGVLANCFDGIDNNCNGVIDLDCALNATYEYDYAAGAIGGTPANLTATSANNTYETIPETPGSNLLQVIWDFYPPGQPGGVFYDLRVEGFRTNTDSKSDTYGFQYATHSSPIGTCSQNESWITPAILTVSKPADDNQLQTAFLAPTSGLICVQAIDSSRSNDTHPDTLTLDRLFMFPSPVAVSDYSSAADKGTLLQGTNYTNTQRLEGSVEMLREVLSGNVSRLVHTWKFTNVPAGSSHKLHIEGYRTSTGDQDNFQFYWSTVDPANNSNETANFTSINGATINSTTEVIGGTDYSFGTATLSGTIYIRVIDTRTTNGSSLDTLSLEHMIIKTVP